MPLVGQTVRGVVYEPVRTDAYPFSDRADAGILSPMFPI